MSLARLGTRHGTHTEGNREVNITNKGEIRGISALRLDELEESVGTLGETAGENFWVESGRGWWSVYWVAN